MGVRTALACAAAALVLGVAGCGDDGDATGTAVGTRTLTVYSSLPLEGPSRRQSEDMVNAYKLALQQAGGHVGPLTVNFVSLDSANAKDQDWTKDQVLDNARQAVRDPNAIAYLGDLDSAATALSLPLTNEAGILQISPSSTYVGLTRAGTGRKGEPDRFYPSGRRTFGRVVPADSVQAAALIGYMRSAGVRRAYLADDRNLYGSGLVTQIARVADRQGIKLLGGDGVEGDGSDFRALARKVARSGADAFLYGGATDSGAGRVYDAVAAAAPRLKLFGPDAVAEESFTSALSPAAARRMHIASPMLPPRLLPAGAAEFRRDFRARFGRAPEPYAIYAYDAMNAALAAIRKAGRLGNRRAAVVQGFFALGRRRSVLGDVTVDRSGDSDLRRYTGRRVEGGRLVFDKVLEVPR